ncbi:MAG TPA: DUF5009 domain-containing protein, partial [Bryobacteraceae bacterium]|nr:DUF5009 domain-containing protein [Bryobacteraceae bacterium]
IFAGTLLAQRRTEAETASWLFLGGNVLIFAGLLLEAFMPVNKQLWTVPYALLTSGVATVVFAGCYWLIDNQGWTRFARPFAIYGANALAMFILSGLFARLIGLIRVGDISLRTLLWRDVFADLGPEAFASLLFSLAHVALFWLIAWGLYRRGWFVRA